MPQDELLDLLENLERERPAGWEEMITEIKEWLGGLYNNEVNEMTFHDANLEHGQVVDWQQTGYRLLPRTLASATTNREDISQSYPVRKTKA